MADIDVQRKGPSIWPWIIGLLVLALIIWAVAEMVDTDEAEFAEVEEVEPVEPVAEVPPAVTPAEPAMGAALPIGEITANPSQWQGRTVSGTVTVVEVPTDRGFWIEQNGQRLFAILRDRPAERPVNIQPGQTLTLSNATVHTDMATVPGDLDADTRQALQGQTAFLVVDESNIQIGSGGTMQPGTTQTQPAPGANGNGMRR